MEGLQEMLSSPLIPAGLPQADARLFARGLGSSLPVPPMLGVGTGRARAPSAPKPCRKPVPKSHRTAGPAGVGGF